MKILIVDDSKMLQAGMKRALVSAGHEVILAGDGKGRSSCRSSEPSRLDSARHDAAYYVGCGGTVGLEDRTVYKVYPDICPHGSFAKE